MAGESENKHGNLQSIVKREQIMPITAANLWPHYAQIFHKPFTPSGKASLNTINIPEYTFTQRADPALAVQPLRPSEAHGSHLSSNTLHWVSGGSTMSNIFSHWQTQIQTYTILRYYTAVFIQQHSWSDKTFFTSLQCTIAPLRTHPSFSFIQTNLAYTKPWCMLDECTKPDYGLATIPTVHTSNIHRSFLLVFRFLLLFIYLFTSRAYNWTSFSCPFFLWKMWAFCNSNSLRMHIDRCLVNIQVMEVYFYYRHFRQISGENCQNIDSCDQPIFALKEDVFRNYHWITYWIH